MDCIGEETMVAWLAGDLSDDARDAIILHIDGCDACHGLVAEVAQHMSVTLEVSPGATTKTAARILARGDRVGRYTIVECVGAGGMGVVYAATDGELERKVAVKVLRGEHEGGRVPLLREAKTLAKLAHPNVVTVFDVGRVDGRVFLAMEFVEGRSLRAWLARSRRSIDEIAATFRQAGEALLAAHELGIVHGDFKPENVMVGDDGRVRVIDFGLSRVEKTASEIDGAARGGESVFGGTPAYMAPELLAGGRPDALGDQFAFGVSLFEAIYGRKPFAAARSRDAGDGVEIPDAPRVPARFSAVLTRALATARDARFASMRDLLAAMDARAESRRGAKRRLAVAAIGSALGVAAVFGARALFSATATPGPTAIAPSRADGEAANTASASAPAAASSSASTPPPTVASPTPSIDRRPPKPTKMSAAIAKPAPSAAPAADAGAPKDLFGYPD